MRIEIPSDRNSALSSFKNDLNGMRIDANAIINDMDSVCSKIDGIHCGVGNLEDAQLSAKKRIVSEEERIDKINHTSNSVDQFVEKAVQTDSRVAKNVKASKDEMYNDYPWMRPQEEGFKEWWDKHIGPVIDDIGKAIGDVISGVVDFIKNNFVQLAVGTVAIAVGAAITVLTGGAGGAVLAAFCAAFMQGVVSVAAGAAIGALVESGIKAIFFDKDFWPSFGESFATGYAFGGICFASGAVFSGLKRTIKPVHRTRQENAPYIKKSGDLAEVDAVRHFSLSKKNIKTQVNIKGGKSGTVSRADIVCENWFSKKLQIIEVKGSNTAGLSDHQKIVYKELEEVGGYILDPRFKGREVLEAGTKVKLYKSKFNLDTTVDLIRLKELSSCSGIGASALMDVPSLFPLNNN